MKPYRVVVDTMEEAVGGRARVDVYPVGHTWVVVNAMLSIRKAVGMGSPPVEVTCYADGHWRSVRAEAVE